ncbi:MAG: hypothetical protein J0M15_07990 [Deltaproteobacteria bacterium]|jgi:hypothetical protein|nr:hypothetical protein [Deltaproteobacteria bacterium]
MEVSKFIVGVLTIALTLFFLGKLTPGILFMAQKASQGFSDNESFKLGKFNRSLQK